MGIYLRANVWSAFAGAAYRQAIAPDPGRALMSRRTSTLWNTSLTQIMIAFPLVAEPAACGDD